MTLRLKIETMCVHFFNFDHLRIILQSSDLFWGTKFRAPSLPLPPFIFSYLQALIHCFLWWWASSRLIFSFKWHLQSSFFLLHSSAMIFKKQRTPLMKKIQGLQAPHGATSCDIRASSSWWRSFASSIFLFSQYTLIPCSSSYSTCISSIVLWFGAV